MCHAMASVVDACDNPRACELAVLAVLHGTEVAEAAKTVERCAAGCPQSRRVRTPSCRGMQGGTRSVSRAGGTVSTDPSHAPLIALPRLLHPHSI